MSIQKSREHGKLKVVALEAAKLIEMYRHAIQQTEGGDRIPAAMEHLDGALKSLNSFYAEVNKPKIHIAQDIPSNLIP